MHHNDISVGYQKRQTHHAITKVMEQTGCRSRSFSSVKSNMSSVKHQVNFRHWWLPRNNESEALLTIQPKLCLFFSNPDHPSPLSSLSLPPYPNPSLCSHYLPKHHSPTMCIPSLLVQQLPVTIHYPSSLFYYPSSPFCPFSLPHLPITLVAPLTDIPSPDTVLSVHPGGLQNVILEVYEIFLNYFYTEGRQNPKTQHKPYFVF